MKIKDRLITFSKAQVSAFTGGMVDYATMIFVTEVIHVHYTISIIISGVVGAYVNFSINKNWSFVKTETSYAHSQKVQLFRFVIVVINSIFLKSSGTYLLTSNLGLDYKISRILVDLVVSVLFNYNLQKWWVFKKSI